MKAKKIVADFSAALARLTEALAVPAEDDLVRAGCIQYFEFCFELAWKSIKVCGTEQGLESCNSPKRCLKLASSLGWIGDEMIWLEMLSARNRMAHTYDASYALEIYDSLSSFLQAFRELLEAWKRKRFSDTERPQYQRSDIPLCRLWSGLHCSAMARQRSGSLA